MDKGYPRFMPTSVEFTGRTVNDHNNPTGPVIELDATELLVYGECGCRTFRMAAPEGSRWPECPNCGDQVAPSKFTPPADSSQWKIYREHRLAYVAELRLEREAVEKIRGERDRVRIAQLERQLEVERSNRRWRWPWSRK